MTAAPRRAYDTDLLSALSEKVMVGDGAMGTMLQAADLTLDDFNGLEGCNEILNVTRPDVLEHIHRCYFEAGADAVETNTFGCNVSNLGDYDIADRIRELSETGTGIARRVADQISTPDRRRYVLGSLGPGTKLPTLGHIDYAVIRDAYEQAALGMLDGGADAILVETCQDLLQLKAAVLGSRRAMARAGRHIPVITHVTVETTGTMLLGTEIGAALTAIEPLGVDMIGLNCATGPAEMSEHLRHLSRHARTPVSVMPNAGLPVLGPTGAEYPLRPEELADALSGFVTEFGLSLVGGCCGTTPEHIRQVADAVRGVARAPRNVTYEPAVSSLYAATPFAQDASVLMIGERTNANGSKAFREAMIAEDYQRCLDIAKEQTRDGAHLLDLCVDYVGRDGVADMTALASRLATASTLPLMLDSTETPVLRAGLEHLGGRCAVNSVNYEDGDGPESRFSKTMELVAEHGAAVVALTIDEEGQARTAEKKVQIAERLIEDITANWGVDESSILIDCLTFTICTGQEESRRDGIETIEAIRELKTRHPDVQTTLGLSNISFGLNPAARQVLNSVFLHDCVEAGMNSAIVNASKILPLIRFNEHEIDTARDLIYDRRKFDGDVCTYDPLVEFTKLFEGKTAQSIKPDITNLPVEERLKHHIIDG
ncbi:MAG: homocysteine S-methyltransferase family protein, partial [Mycobacteriaceae bacterium]|nr:homocysteine S-methyltransferase family protein [Mycobacteriaceae bacterium]